ncbi:MAG: (Fe-S)-binding protein [Planctomycetes bacterium]|nr:(Fe-S)-binding protein [Planctomycetota bacterium]
MTEPAVLPKDPCADFASAEGRAHFARSLDCVHCGLCLPVCPTYQLTGNEASSPRGRIYMMRAVADGRISAEPGSTYDNELHFCLVCRACETVCPSGVQMEALVEHARCEMNKKTGPPSRARRFLLRTVLPDRKWLRRAADATAIYSKTPIGKILRKLGIVDWLFPGATAREALMPHVPKREHRRDLPALLPPVGEKRGRVAFQEGCVASQLLQDINEATVRVLTRNGWEVSLWKNPSCCGALHAHAGDLEFARELAKKNIEEFEKTKADFFILNSAGCGSHIKNYARLLEVETGWLHRAKEIAAKTRDIGEFLVETGYKPRNGPRALRVAYDEPCHLVHGQRVSAQPKQLLQSIPGLQLVPLAGATDCCGAAGLYSLERTTDSMAILDGKMQQIRASGCEVLATGNPGCILQYRLGARRAGMNLQIMHPIQLLDEG